MRKLSIVAFLLLTLMAGAAGIGQAQTPEPQAAEGTQSSDEIQGASVEILAESTSTSGAVGMTLYRIILEPETEVPDHEHFGSVTWYVDSGTLAFKVISGEVWVRCHDCVPDGASDASGFVLVPEGTEVVLETGDWIIQHGATVHAYRNAGDIDVVIDASTTYELEGNTDATPAGGPFTIRSCRGGCM